MSKATTKGRGTKQSGPSAAKFGKKPAASPQSKSTAKIKPGAQSAKSKPASAKTPNTPSSNRTTTHKVGSNGHSKPQPAANKSSPKQRPAATGKTPTSKPKPGKSPINVSKPAAPKSAKKAPPTPTKPPAPAPNKASKKSKKSGTKPEVTVALDKDLASKSARAGGSVKDQITLTVPDPYWLHAYWQLSVQSVQRAEAALGQDWHGAKPILRLFDVTSTDTTSTSETPIRDISIHGGCTHWYIDIPQPPRAYRIDIGYITRNQRFFPISRSNVVTPPEAGSSEVLEENWQANKEEQEAREAAAPDDRFQRPLKEPTFGPGAVLPGKLKKFFFDIDAELIVYGRTDPTAAVSLQNEPVKIRPDGSFTMRFSLPDSRQIILAVATAADGMEEQTIVLAVERNTKRLDPMIYDLYGDA